MPVGACDGANVGVGASLGVKLGTWAMLGARVGGASVTPTGSCSGSTTDFRLAKCSDYLGSRRRHAGTCTGMWVVGEALGRILGLDDGDPGGERLGLPLGDDDGDALGLALGRGVGGDADGLVLGLDDGPPLGDVLVLALGDREGDMLGDELGGESSESPMDSCLAQRRATAWRCARPLAE